MATSHLEMLNVELYRSPRCDLQRCFPLGKYRLPKTQIIRGAFTEIVDVAKTVAECFPRLWSVFCFAKDLRGKCDAPSVVEGYRSDQYRDIPACLPT